MKRILLISGSAALLAGMAMAETWSGTLVDVMCRSKDLASHTTKCAVSCAKSGYGLVLPDGKFVKFDEGGNARALAMLELHRRKRISKRKSPELSTAIRWQ